MSADANLKNEVFTIKVRQLFELATASVPLNLAVGGLLLYVLWQEVPHAILWSWFTCLALLSLLRLWHAHLWRAKEMEAACARRQSGTFAVATAASGLIWAASFLLFAPPLDTLNRMFVLLVLGGMAAGGLSSLSVMFVMYLIYIGAIFIPVLIGGYLAGTLILFPEGELLLIFMLALALSAWDNHRTAHEAIVQRLARRQADAAHARIDRHLQAVVENVVDAIITIDARGIIQTFNPAAECIFGYAAAEVVGKNVSMLMPQPDSEAHDGYLQHYLNGGTPKIIGNVREVLARRKGGDTFPVELSVSEMRGEEGEVHFVGLLRDISERKAAEQERQQRDAQLLRHQEALYELASFEEPDLKTGLAILNEHAAELLAVDRASIWLLDEGGGTLRCLDLFERQSGEHSAGMVLKAENYPAYFEALASGAAIEAHDALRDPRTAEFAEDYLLPLGITAMLDAAIWMRGKVVGVLCLEHVGHPRHWTHDEVIFAADYAQQATQFLLEEKRRAAEAEIRHMAHHDKLTGLPNRALFHERLGMAMAYAERHRRPFALLFIDLDGFKQVNDSLGHDAGDQLLVQVAARLSNCVRREDTVARLGGDEFTIILTEAKDEEACGRAAEKIITEISRPIPIQGKDCRIGASIGIARYPADGDDDDGLISAADTAMYAAKLAGKNTYRLAAAAANA